MTDIAHYDTADGFPGFHREFDDLVSEHFQPLYSLNGLFDEDPQTNLERTEAVFRTAAARREVTATGLYRIARETIDFSRSACPLLTLMSLDDALCWLLKELSGLRYREIAQVMEQDEVQVRIHIANARSSLLPFM